MFGNLKLAPKLIGSFVFLSTATAVVGLVAWLGTRGLEKGIHDIGGVMLPSLRDVLRAGEALHAVDGGENALMNTRMAGEERAATYDEMRTDMEHAEAALKSYEVLPRLPDEDALWRQFQPEFKAWQVGHAAFVEAAKRYDGSRSDADYDAMATVMIDEDKAFGKVSDLLDRIADINAKAADEESIAVMRSATRVNYTIAVIAVMAVLCAITLGLLIARSIARPMIALRDAFQRVADGRLAGTQLESSLADEIGEATRAASDLIDNQRQLAALLEKIGQGDLRETLPSRHTDDEIARSVNAMLANLRQLVAESRESARQVNAGATQVNSASEDLSRGATEQAASLEEISSSVAQLSSQVSENARSAGQAASLAEKARASAAEGDGQIQLTVVAMRGMGDASREIGKVIKVIDDIAFQTNLLALNAAVEAARAGAHGKGFAVVADEVRNLASRSAKAAKETSDMVTEAAGRMGDGLSQATKASEILREIVEGATMSSELVNRIATASNEQANALRQISQGLSQISDVTQQNTANSEETAAASAELSSQAGELSRLLSRFQMT